MINRGYRYKLQATDEQQQLFRHFAGVCRLIYNLALEQRRDWYKHYEARTGSKLNYIAQARELTELRKSFDWIADVSQTCQQQTLRDLDRAFANFFKGITKYPTLRKKGLNDTFRFQGREVAIQKLNGKWSVVKLPKIGWVKFRDTRSMRGKINNATISLAADGWYISFACTIDHETPTNDHPSVGIDRGVASTLTLSTGEMLSLPDSLLLFEKKRRTAQKRLSRKKRGSKRYAKQRKRIAVLQARTARIRKDWHHKNTLVLSQRFSTVVLENLNTKGMTASAKGTSENHGKKVKAKSGLNRVILNQGWHIFETLLAYKLEERGGNLVKVNPAYTSQTCSACGAIDKESRKNQASFLCQSCGHRTHADINAAINILRRNTASMDVEVEHKFSCEASTGMGISPRENPPALAGGRC